MRASYGIAVKHASPVPYLNKILLGRFVHKEQCRAAILYRKSDDHDSRERERGRCQLIRGIGTLLETTGQNEAHDAGSPKLATSLRV